MAISKILHMKQAKSGFMAKHLANGLKYIMDPEKTENGRYICGNNCLPDNALQQMLDTKKHFGKLDKRQGYHLIISFNEGEVSEDTAFEVVGQFVKEYLGPDFEEMCIRDSIRIRRLTPLECFRLMGFDDEDFWKAKNAGVSDSQLYKQAGNSIVVDVLFYVFLELYSAMPELFDDVRLASFFSGIGAFEKALERLEDYLNQ